MSCGAHERYIHPLVLDALKRFGAETLVQGDRDVRKSYFRKSRIADRTNGWKNAVGMTPTKSSPCSPRAARRVDSRRVRSAEHRPDIVEEHAPGLRQIDSASLAAEELDVELAANLLDALAE
jgi:hypothetical protein